MMRRGALCFAPVNKPGVMPKTKLPVPDFSDRTIYSAKTYAEIIRGIITLQLCRVNYLATRGPALLKGVEHTLTTLKVPEPLAEKLVYETAVKWTMFRHFCGGVSADALKPVLQRLEKLGIGAILDYAAEADVPSVLFKEQSNQTFDPLDVSMKSLVNRPDLKYNVANDALYDANLKIFLDCIDAGRASYSDREVVCFAAVKFTGLVEPQLLARISAVLLSIRQGWVKIFTNDPTPRNLEDCRVVTGRLMPVTSRFCSKEQAMTGLKSAWKPETTEEQRAAFVSYLIRRAKETQQSRNPAAVDSATLEQVDYLVYIDEVAKALLSRNPPKELAPMLDVLPRFSKVELDLYDKFIARARAIAQRGSEKLVYVTVDAEQTFYQMAIDHFVRELQRDFNKQLPIIFNTYQCYMLIGEDRLRNDLARADREGWVWGGKPVRGAYMRQERETAAKFGYQPPIQPTKDKTDECYNKTAEIIIDYIVQNPNVPVGAMFATHNTESCQKICQMMQKIDMAKNKSVISFGQLLGMADYLSIPLAKSGYLVFKYVPYGPVKACMQYLGRRALENSAVAATSQRDSQLMWSEVPKRQETIIAAVIFVMVVALWWQRRQGLKREAARALALQEAARAAEEAKKRKAVADEQARKKAADEAAKKKKQEEEANAKKRAEDAAKIKSLTDELAAVKQLFEKETSDLKAQLQAAVMDGLKLKVLQDENTELRLRVALAEKAAQEAKQAASASSATSDSSAGSPASVDSNGSSNGDWSKDYYRHMAEKDKDLLP